MAAPRVSASTVALRTRTSNGYPPNWQMPFNASGNGDFAASRVNTGAQYSPGTIALSQKADAPASDTYVTYSGFPAYSLVSKTGYQVAALLGRPQRIDDSLAGYQSIVAV